MNIKSATGHYVNIFSEDGLLDLFIILNESNPEPTTDDYIFIENTITESVDRYGYINKENIKQILDFEFKGGVQIINNSIGYAKL